jgi:hypothetical protein
MNQLEAIGDSIWLVDGEVVNFYGFPYPTRSVVVRLDNGNLWIWSPIGLSANLRSQIDQLGRVTHLVSPNKIHQLYLQDWKASYPGAKVWGPQSTIHKRTDLSFEAPLTNEAPSDWSSEIDQFWFQGSPALDEVVFHHRKSGTAILADLSENFGQEFLEAQWAPWKRLIARTWKITEPFGYPPLEWRLSWWRRKGARAVLQRLLATEPRQVVMAHGEWQASDGRRYLEKAFGWLSKD